MDNEKPSYYAILTADVRYDKRLSSSEKLMFAEITALSNANNRCHANNMYFSKLYKVSKGTISRWINNLKRHGYVNIVINMSGKQVISRYITPINKNNDTLIIKNDNTPISKNDENLYSKSARIIIQDINNTSINNKRKDVSNYSDEFEKFWKYYERNGNKKKSYLLWIKLSEKQKTEIREKLPSYVKHTNINGVYPSRKNAEVYLNPKNEHWNDRVVIVDNDSNNTYNTNQYKKSKREADYK